MQKIEKGLSYKPILHNVIGGLIIALSFGYLGYTLIRNWDQLASYEWHINYCQMAYAFILYSFSLVLAVSGWRLIINSFIPVKHPIKHLKYYVYTNLLRRLPAPLFYLLGRIYFYEQAGVNKPVIITVSLLEWILIVLSGGIVYLLTLPFVKLPLGWYSLWFPVAIVAAGVLLFHPKVIQAMFYLLGQKETSIPLGYRIFLSCLAIYSLVWIGGGLTLYATINSLYALPLSSLPTVIGAWILSGLVTTLIFLTSAGLGLKELTLSLLLGYVIPLPIAIVVALLMRVCLIIFEIVWGIVVIKL